jgi:hypothetical protein
MLQVTTRFFGATAVSAAVFSISPLVAARSTTSPAPAPETAPSELVNHAAPEAVSPAPTKTMTVVSGSSTIQTAALTPETDNVSEEPDYLKMRKAGYLFALGLETLLPSGSLDAGATRPVRDLTGPLLAIALAGGFRFTPYFSATADFSLGMALTVPNTAFPVCEETSVDCSSALLRYGTSARYTVNPQDYVAWWVSAGVGQSHFLFSIEKEHQDVGRLWASSNELVFKTGINLAQSPVAKTEIYLTGSWGRLYSVSGYSRTPSTLDAPRTYNRYELDAPGSYSWFGLGFDGSY